MQGYGRPGYNFGNLQFGTPLDFNFYFPGYGDGSFSGDLAYSANSAHNYQRMPHIVTMNSVRQAIPRIWLPEAITQGKAMGHLTDVSSVQGQFFPFGYPSPGTCASRCSTSTAARCSARWSMEIAGHGCTSTKA